MVERIMVNMAKVNPDEVAKDTGLSEKDVAKVVKQIINNKNNHRQMPRVPAPEGGICLREAARKYGISHPTLSRRVRDGSIKILSRTKNWLYIDEEALRKYLSEQHD